MAPNILADSCACPCDRTDEVADALHGLTCPSVSFEEAALRLLAVRKAVAFGLEPWEAVGFAAEAALFAGLDS